MNINILSMSHGMSMRWAEYLGDGQGIWEMGRVFRRWAEYFQQVLNVADVREANINVVGN